MATNGTVAYTGCDFTERHVHMYVSCDSFYISVSNGSVRRICVFGKGANHYGFCGRSETSYCEATARCLALNKEMNS